MLKKIFKINGFIKSDLKKLGIEHDNFFSETDIVNKDLVKKRLKLLKKDNLVEEGYLRSTKRRKR